MKECHVGIDVGSSSVKVSVVKWEILSQRLSLVGSCQEPYHDSRQFGISIPMDLIGSSNVIPNSSLLHEQNAEVILNAVSKCVYQAMQIREKYLASSFPVTKLAVCGQMHGVIMWTAGTKVVACEDKSLKISGPVSRLITWQDQRCSKEFLQSLPSSREPLCSGYGCASLFWFAKHAPAYLEQFTHAGTIADFVLAMLCDLPAVPMSDHNALSWGYYHMDSKSWQLDLLANTEFPVRLLPTVVPACTVVGKTALSWSALPLGAEVHVALGDAQCSVKATQFLPHQAVLNMGTSCQLAFLSSSAADESTHLHRWPFKGDNCLSVLASMNGGNVLAAFVEMLHGWMSTLGANIPEASIWSKLSDMTSLAGTGSNLVVHPTLAPERGGDRGQLGAAVTNISFDNTSLAQVYQQICIGLMRNLSDMLPKDSLSRNNITEIKCCGSVFNKHPFFITAVKEVFPSISHVSVCGDGDAAYGAVLMAQ